MSTETQMEFDARRAQLKQMKKEAIETRKKESLEYMKRIMVGIYTVRPYDIHNASCLD